MDSTDGVRPPDLAFSQQFGAVLHSGAWTLWHHALAADQAVDREEYRAELVHQMVMWLDGLEAIPTEYSTCYEAVMDFSMSLTLLHHAKIVRSMVESIQAIGSQAEYDRSIQDMMLAKQSPDTFAARMVMQRVWASRQCYKAYNNLVQEMIQRSKDTTSRRERTALLPIILEIYETIEEESEKPEVLSVLANSLPELPALPSDDADVDVDGEETGTAAKRTMVRRTSVKSNLSVIEKSITEAKQAADEMLKNSHGRNTKKQWRLFSSANAGTSKKQRRKKESKQKKAAKSHVRTQSDLRVNGNRGLSYQYVNDGLITDIAANDTAGAIAIQRSIDDALGASDEPSTSSSGGPSDDQQSKSEDNEEELEVQEEEEEEEEDEEYEPTQAKKSGMFDRVVIEHFVSACWTFLQRNGVMEGVSAFLASYKFPRQNLTTNPDSRKEHVVMLVSERIALSPTSFIYHEIGKVCSRMQDDLVTDQGMLRLKLLESCARTFWSSAWDDMLTKMLIYEKSCDALRKKTKQLERAFFDNLNPLSATNEMNNLWSVREYLRDAYERMLDEVCKNIRHGGGSVRTSSETTSVESDVDVPAKPAKVTALVDRSDSPARHRSQSWINPELRREKRQGKIGFGVSSPRSRHASVSPLDGSRKTTTQ